MRVMLDMSLVAAKHGLKLPQGFGPKDHMQDPLRDRTGIMAAVMAKDAAKKKQDADNRAADEKAWQAWVRTGTISQQMQKGIDKGYPGFGKWSGSKFKSAGSTFGSAPAGGSNGDWSASDCDDGGSTIPWFQTSRNGMSLQDSCAAYGKGPKAGGGSSFGSGGIDPGELASHTQDFNQATSNVLGLGGGTNWGQGGDIHNSLGGQAHESVGHYGSTQHWNDDPFGASNAWESKRYGY